MDEQNQLEIPTSETHRQSDGWLAVWWTELQQSGRVKPVLRVLTHLFSLVLVLGLVWVLQKNYFSAQSDTIQSDTLASQAVVQQQVFAAELSTPTPGAVSVSLPPATDISGLYVFGIPRLALLHTTIPTRPRVEVTTYTVQQGDSLFTIADKFGLRPETILWGNFDVLQDNPNILQPDQVLNILPIDGTYHQWREGENFRKVADFYGVDPQDIIQWPGNHMALDFDPDNPNIKAGTMLIIPGGTRALRDWGPPPIARTNPAVAATYGPGFCGQIYEGAVGTGVFIWPTTDHFLSGYDYSPTIHPGIDIAGDFGYPIYAVDAGVVVYSGWSNWGYGNLIVIDHGNGWQSLYAHLNSVYVGCGMSVAQGSVLGEMGSTGNSSGPHLHFELRNDVWGKVNPWNFLP